MRMVPGKVASPSQDDDRRIAYTLIAWLSLPQLGSADSQIPISAHPISDCSEGCSTREVQILHPNLLTEWLRLPLDPVNRKSAVRSSNARSTVVMDSYLESILRKGDYELFARELTSDRDWCAPLPANYRWLGGVAELASIRIAQEITRHYFPPSSSRPCEHLSLGDGTQKAVMWDPRLVLPTPAGRSIRTSLLRKETLLCGPHPLLRATESYLPDIVPLGIQVTQPPSALFSADHSSDVDVVSIGRVAPGHCRAPLGIQYLGILQTALSVSVGIVRPVVKLFPRAARTTVKRYLPALFSQRWLQAVLRRGVQMSLGFTPIPLGEKVN
jgi:hypothetical protein